MMSEYERALLRLKCWEALTGWGTIEPPDDCGEDTSVMRKLTAHKPWHWGQRLDKADELYQWTIAQDDEEPSP